MSQSCWQRGQGVAQGQVRQKCATAARRSGGGGKVVGSLLHEGSAALEGVATAVGGLDAVVVDVRQGEFADFSKRVRLLGSPVPEAGAV